MPTFSSLYSALDYYNCCIFVTWHVPGGGLFQREHFGQSIWRSRLKDTAMHYILVLLHHVQRSCPVGECGGNDRLPCRGVVLREALVHTTPSQNCELWDVRVFCSLRSAVSVQFANQENVSSTLWSVYFHDKANTEERVRYNWEYCRYVWTVPVPCPACRGKQRRPCTRDALLDTVFGDVHVLWRRCWGGGLGLSGQGFCVA